MKKIDLLSDFAVLAQVTSTCKQDYDNCTFFYGLDNKISLHFSTIAYDYYRLLLIDMHTVLSTSLNDKYTFREFFNKIDSGRYTNEAITQTHTTQWRAMLLRNSATIEGIKYLRDKKIAHIDQNIYPPIIISMKNIQKLLFTMEDIILDICKILELPLEKITTMDEQHNHNILDAFNRIRLDTHHPKPSLGFSPFAEHLLK